MSAGHSDAPELLDTREQVWRGLEDENFYRALTGVLRKCFDDRMNVIRAPSDHDLNVLAQAACVVSHELLNREAMRRCAH